MSLYVRHTGDSQVRHTGDALPKSKYSRIPWEVGTDIRLMPRDVLVYFALAASVWQGNVATVGHRWVSEIIHVSPRLVRDSLKRLELAGHIIPAEIKRGQRAGYVLPSPVFAAKQGKVDEVVTAPSGRRHLVSVRATA